MMTWKVLFSSNVLRFLIREGEMWGWKQLYLSNKHFELDSPALNRNPAGPLKSPLI